MKNYQWIVIGLISFNIIFANTDESTQIKIVTFIAEVMIQVLHIIFMRKKHEMENTTT